MTSNLTFNQLKYLISFFIASVCALTLNFAQQHSALLAARSSLILTQQTQAFLEIEELCIGISNTQHGLELASVNSPWLVLTYIFLGIVLFASIGFFLVGPVEFSNLSPSSFITPEQNLSPSSFIIPEQNIVKSFGREWNSNFRAVSDTPAGDVNITVCQSQEFDIDPQIIYESSLDVKKMVGQVFDAGGDLSVPIRSLSSDEHIGTTVSHTVSMVIDNPKLVHFLSDIHTLEAFFEFMKTHNKNTISDIVREVSFEAYLDVISFFS